MGAMPVSSAGLFGYVHWGYESKIVNIFDPTYGLIYMPP